MADCCGLDRTTKYCPRCGKRVQKWDLYDLLRYCSTNAKRVEQEIEQHNGELKQLRTDKALTEEVKEKAAEVLRRKITTYDKWSMWADSLKERLDAEDKAVQEAEPKVSQAGG